MSLIVRLLAITVLCGVLALLLGPAMTIETARPGLDKVAHFVSFGLVLWAMGVLFRRRSRLALAAAAIVLGAVIEILQALVGRDAELLDVAADALGVLAALGLWSVLRGFRPRSHADDAASDRAA